MASLSLGLIPEGNAGTGVDDGGLLDDETIAVEAGDIAAGVGQRDLVDLIGVEPDLALTALEDVGRKALLEFERHYWDKARVVERTNGEMKLKENEKQRRHEMCSTVPIAKIHPKRRCAPTARQIDYISSQPTTALYPSSP